jgi:hypothetical protein
MSPTPRPSRSSLPGFTRRQLIQTGALGMIGLDLPQLLSAERTSPGGRKGREKSCIFIVQYGGASHIDMLDPKPNAPAAVRGPYKPIATSVPGMQITDMLPNLAKLSQHYCLLRSMTHDKHGHGPAMEVCLSGQTNPPPQMPSWCSVVSCLKPATARFPSYIWIKDLDIDVSRAYLGAGSLGQKYGPLLVAERQEDFARPQYCVKLFDLPEGLSRDRLATRFELLSRLGAESAIKNHSAPQEFRQCQQQAWELVSGQGASQAFDLGHEKQALRDRYGRHPLGQNLLAARRLIEAGARLVAVNAWCGHPASEKFRFTEGWDHHGVAFQYGGIFSNTQDGLGFVLPRFDQALSALLEDLEVRGRLEDTLVVVVGEFGRTPRIVQRHFAGRDHWPVCYSALLAGGGIRGGAVWGKSDKEGKFVQQHPVSPEDLTATIYQALGITTEDRLSLGPRIPVINGPAIRELFA